MGFFEALFGGSYMAGKYASDIKKANEAKIRGVQSATDAAARQQEWLARVTDKNLEIELEDFIFHEKNYDQIWAEVSEAYKDMPWNSDRTSILCCGYDRNDRNAKEALRIMMAIRGKLIYDDAKYGIEQTKIQAPTRLQTRQVIANQLGFVKWIDSKLKEHGIDEQLVIEVTWDSVFTVDSCEWRNGTYKWMPMIHSGVRVKDDIPEV